MTNNNNRSFIGCEGDYCDSKIVIFGAPFDGTTSYRPGTRFAPTAIRNESYSIETYSPHQDKDLTEYKIFDAGDLELCFGNTERVINCIEEYTERLIFDNKLPVMLGGEHLVTLGAVRAAYKKYAGLVVVHFDAHTDLRDNYLGEKLSHATVIRRCQELVGDGNIYSFGIRSGEKDEFLYAKEHINLNKFNLNGINEAVKRIKDRPVYLTIDQDVLDSSVFPGTGTPEAGGVSYSELLDAIKKLSACNIISADLNELSPVYDASGASTSLSCKLLRELLLYLCK